MIHFGNIFCLTAALVLGGVRGSLAGGLGMGLFDLISGTYALYSPGTFSANSSPGLSAASSCTGGTSLSP